MSLAKYIVNGKTIYRLHSPFVFDFAKNVIKDQRKFYAFDLIEERRNHLLKRKEIITVTDYGAGSKSANSNNRSLSQIARSASVSKKFGKILFRLVQHYKPAYVLEFGSCVGIGSLYLSAAMSSGKFITLEGDPTLSSIAREGLNHIPMKLHDAEVITGEFSKTLPLALSHLPQIDLAFIDGNHQKEPTLQYFDALLPKCHARTIVVFDDIHWSKEMEETWEAIKAHPRTKLTIDLFRMGIVFFVEDHLEVEHFQLYT